MTAETLTIRQASMEDVPGIDDLLSLSYARLLRADYPPSVMVTVMPILSRAQPALIRSARYYLVTSGDQILGCGGWSAAPPGGGTPRDDEGHLRHIAVAPDMARRGVGGRLLRHILSEMVGQGVRRAHSAATRTAVPFYKAFGFSAGAEVMASLRPGIEFPLVPMLREL